MKNNTSLNKSAFCIGENLLKNEEFELEVFSGISKNSSSPEKLTEEIIDTLDIQNLRSILKEKCIIIQSFDEKIKVVNKNFTNLLNAEKVKNDELKTINKLQKKEIQKNYKIIMDLKKEMTLFQEKANKIFENANLKKNSNYFMTTEEKDSNPKKDLNDIKMLENQFSGDSEVSFTSKIDNNHIYRKWFSDEKNISINFDDLEIKFRKVNDLNSEAMNFIEKKEFKFIDVEICNSSASKFLISKLELESTESKIFFN